MLRVTNFSVSNTEAFNNFRAENEAPLREAVGYLTMWGADSYGMCNLHWSAGQQELTAHYSHTGSSRVYVICEVWHPEEKRYSFHS